MNYSKIEPKEFGNKLFSLDGISKKTMEEHHKLYQGYVNKYNEIIELINNLTDDDYTKSNQSYSKIRELKVELTFAWGGVVNHEIYFNHLNGKPSQPGEILSRQIESDFGSFDNFKKDLKATAIAARGWVWVCWNRRMGKLFNYLADAHNLYGLWGVKPIMVIDTYEHAYFIDYGANRGSYIEAVFKNIDWNEVDKRFEKVYGQCRIASGKQCCQKK